MDWKAIYVFYAVYISTIWSATTIRFKDRTQENSYAPETGKDHLVTHTLNIILYLLLTCSSLPGFSWKQSQEAGRFLGWRGKFRSWCLYLQRFLASQHNVKPATVSLEDHTENSPTLLPLPQVFKTSRCASVNETAKSRWLRSWTHLFKKIIIMHTYT